MELNVLRLVLLIIVLALAQSHPKHLKPIIESFYNEANKSLALYIKHTSSSLLDHTGAYNVGCIHEPQENLNITLFQEKLSMFHCYMKVAVEFDLDDLSEELRKTFQHMVHLMKEMRVTPTCPAGTCALDFDFEDDDYQQLSFVRSLLVLYTKWMAEIRKKLQ
ncbi:hypothetical protein AAFF_G00425200 [Aldrovandia affinis]|uniref:Uncharacterized protein n=1 Tax=Aldrovandia affinis TaxID=143900 RepID=A0AAD7T736_9TELE|nr:hypothetical protein AAFF_G00425200 [Aldrovandia affinis]